MIGYSWYSEFGFIHLHHTTLVYVCLQILCRKDDEESYTALLNALKHNKRYFIVKKLENVREQLIKKEEDGKHTTIG